VRVVGGVVGVQGMQETRIAFASDKSQGLHHVVGVRPLLLDAEFDRLLGSPLRAQVTKRLLRVEVGVSILLGLGEGGGGPATDDRGGTFPRNVPLDRVVARALRVLIQEIVRRRLVQAVLELRILVVNDACGTAGSV
jgi:hypothetical protein